MFSLSEKLVTFIYSGFSKIPQEIPEESKHSPHPLPVM